MKTSLARVLGAIAVAAALGAPSAAAAQSPEDSNPSSLFIEAGGNGLLYSVNYEARFLNHFAARVGFAFFNVLITNSDQVEQEVGVGLLPLMANVLIGGGNSRIEIGAGPLIGLAGSEVRRVEHRSAYIEMDDLSVVGFTSAIGYRYQRLGGGLLIRATLTPFYSGEAQMWGGISLGLSL